MPSWLILFTIIVICLAVLTYTKGSKSVESFGDFKDLQMKFADRQSTYFHDTAGKAIYTNPGLNLSSLNDAVRQPDLYLPTSPDRDYTSYFTEDPENHLSVQDETFCKKAMHPRDLPSRQPKSKMACGWYYINDVATPSVGALGTISGALFPSKLPANGEWIWDIPTAIMKEELKSCKRVKSCDLINVNGIHGRCGFCERLGYAVPINFDGSEKYPDAQEACGQSTIRDANQCFKPSQPVTTPSGTSCGTYGRPSPDNSLRYYTKEECTKLGGDFSKNGECSKKKGGSFSYDCRTLNNPVTEMAAGPVSVCAPAPNGRISRECQQSLATGLGYAKTGGIMRILASGGSPNEKERMAINQLKTAGYAVPDAILGSGDIDSQSAANLYQKIFEATARGTTNLTRQAAQLLIKGNDSFDVCALDSNQTGPFPTACLQRAFRMAGCQASGHANPTEATSSSYSTKTWGDVTSSFTNLYKAMKSGKSGEQDEAVKKCLGITYTRLDPVKCDYKQTLNGYDETSGRGQICFNSTLKQAKDTCASNPQCKSFSFTNQPNLNDSSVGFGCFKMDKVGFTSTDAFTGFTKLDQPTNGDYQYKGCFNDNPQRAIPVYKGSGHNYDSCKNIAKQLKSDTFALQYYGECWIGNGSDYSKYGQSTNCGDRGGVWAQNVYKQDALLDINQLDFPMTFNGYNFRPYFQNKTLHLASASHLGNSTSAFLTNKVVIKNFKTTFTVKFTGNRADGMTFCFQNKAANALGDNGGNLGVRGITPGASIRIDNYYGPDGRLSVGFNPTNATISDSGSGYKDLAESGDITGRMGLGVRGDWNLDVEIKYFNGTLTYSLTNLLDSTRKYEKSIQINLPSLIGGDRAWVGFTSGTGGLTNNIFITNWKITTAS